MLPADEAARALLEMRNAAAPFLHLVHPRPTAWHTLMAPVAEIYGLQSVPFAQWVALLEQSGRGLGEREEGDTLEDALRRNPARTGRIVLIDRSRRDGVLPVPS